MFRILILAAPLLALLAPTPSGAAETPLEIGVLLPLTGGYAPYGQAERQALTLAEEVINANGGVRGRPLSFVVVDTASDPVTAVKEAKKLVEQRRVTALMGGHSSAVAEAVGAMAVTRRFPYLITNASAERLTDPATYTHAGQRLASLRRDLPRASAVERPLLLARIALAEEKATSEGKSLAHHFSLFRIAPPASDYDQGIASFLTDVAHPRSAVILYERSLAGGARAARLALTLKRLSIPLLLSLSYDPNAADFRPALNNIAPLKPDLLLAVSRGIDAPLLIRQAIELRLSPKLIVGVGKGFTDATFIERAGRAGEYLFTSPLWSPLAPWPGVADFVETFRNRHGVAPDYRSAQAYAGAMVMAEGLRLSDRLEPRYVTEALRKVELMTLIGPVSFTSHGGLIQQNRHIPLLLQWLGDQPRIVWPEELAESPFVYPIDWEIVRKRNNW